LFVVSFFQNWENFSKCPITWKDTGLEGCVYNVCDYWNYITGAESLITLVGILSIPGALFSGKEVIMFSTSEQLILSNKNCSEVG
jgi:hypothetical protein